MTDKINNAQYPWLQFKSVEYKKLSFQSAYPTAYAEGLKYIFNDVPSRLEENSSTSPIEYQLEQNYPNPFNPTTTIKYSIPNVSSGFSLSNVTLKVYDVLGKEVATLVNEKKPTGNYQVKFNASSADGGLTSGIYFYSLTSGSFKKTKKLILIK